MTPAGTIRAALDERLQQLAVRMTQAGRLEAEFAATERDIRQYVTEYNQARLQPLVDALTARGAAYCPTCEQLIDSVGHHRHGHSTNWESWFLRRWASAPSHELPIELRFLGEQIDWPPDPIDVYNRTSDRDRPRRQYFELRGPDGFSFVGWSLTEPTR